VKSLPFPGKRGDISISGGRRGLPSDADEDSLRNGLRMKRVGRRGGFYVIMYRLTNRERLSLVNGLLGANLPKEEGEKTRATVQNFPARRGRHVYIRHYAEGATNTL